MRAQLHKTRHSAATAADRIVLIGTGMAAVSALWDLTAAGAHVRWYVDRADVGTETILASGLASKLGRGGIELTFDDPRAAPLDGTTAVVVAHGDDLDLNLAERARVAHVPVHVVDRPDLSTAALADIEGAARSALNGRAVPQTA